MLAHCLRIINIPTGFPRMTTHFHIVQVVSTQSCRYILKNHWCNFLCYNLCKVLNVFIELLCIRTRRYNNKCNNSNPVLRKLYLWTSKVCLFAFPFGIALDQEPHNNTWHQNIVTFCVKNTSKSKHNGYIIIPSFNG